MDASKLNLEPVPAKRSRRGHAAIEVALMSPWILLLFAALFDFGFYAYAAIATANAARVAALHTSSNTAAASDVIGACSQAVEELRVMPNVGPAAVVPCNSCSGNTCSVPDAGNPVIQVTTQAITGAGCADHVPGLVPPVTCSQVAVRYRSVQLFPLPWLMGQFTLTRVVQAKVKAE